MVAIAPGATVLLTGGSGFVGGAIGRALVAGGYRLRLAGRKQGPFSIRSDSTSFTPIGDLRRMIDWNRALDGVEAVVHAAGAPRQLATMTEAELFAINVDASERLARAAKRTGVAKFVLISSVRATCGPTSVDLLTEASQARPEDAYGRSKRAGEEAVLAAGVPSLVFRPVVVHGAGASDNFGALARLSASRLPLPFAGVGGRRSIVSDVNLADAVRFGLSRDLGASRILLVADSKAFTIAEICAAMRRSLGRAPGLFAPPGGLLRSTFRLVGKEDAWRRIAGDLVVSSASIEAEGWSRPEPSEMGLARTISRFLNKDDQRAEG
jgi:nucleoside-diphosphate-sugar epimerase